MYLYADGTLTEQPMACMSDDYLVLKPSTTAGEVIDFIGFKGAQVVFSEIMENCL